MPTPTASLSDQRIPHLFFARSRRLLFVPIFYALQAANLAFAGSGTWLVNPASSDWNSAANWANGLIPNSPEDVAIFDASSVSNISLSANTRVNSLVFNPAAPPYSITATAPYTLTLSGAGIVNNSGNTQSFVAAVNGTSGIGIITFTNSATAGNNTSFSVDGGTVSGASGGDIEFRDGSNAGSGTFVLNGSAGGAGGGIVGFSDQSSAANATFIVNGPAPMAGSGSGTGYLQFHGTATAANAVVINRVTVPFYGGNTHFYNSSSAASGTFTNEGGTGATAYGGGVTALHNTASADDGTFTNFGGNTSTSIGGATSISDGATIGNGTFYNWYGMVPGALGGYTSITTSSSAGNGTFVNYGGAATGTRGGETIFRSRAGAGDSTFSNLGGTAGNTTGGATIFNDSTSAGNSTFTNEGGTGANGGGGLVRFYTGSTASNGTFTSYAGLTSGANGGAVVFDDQSTAGSGTFINHGSAVSGASAGSTQFFGSSSGANATITNNGGTADGANGADTQFYSSSHADNATITNNGGTVSGARGGTTHIRSESTAGNAMITANAGEVSGALGGTIQFFNTATAASATLVANGGVGGGGSILFLENSVGGRARVKVFDNGNLDISQHSSGVAIGTLEGTGNVFLGAKTLTVGTNNINSTFAGVIQNGGVGGGAAGNFTKIGTGSFTLTGANTYTGATTVNGGVLVVDTTANGSVLNPASNLAVGGGVFQLKGNVGSQSQTLSGLTANSGASVVQVNNLGANTTLDLGSTMTRLAGGTVDFNAASGLFGADALIKTGQANAVSGILGAWATVNGGAALATKNAAGEIVAYTGYTALDAQAGGANSTINDGETLNYGINNAGVSGNVALAAATTNINTLTQDFTTASTIDTAGKILRVGAIGGISITPGKADLTIGTAANSGALTAGGNVTNGAGELILSNHSAGNLTVNSTITENGTGIVRLTKSGSGLVVLNGSNTFTGGSTLNSGTLRLGSVSALGIAGRALRINGGTLELATDTTVNALNTTIAASATILSNKATAASAGITHTLGTLGIGTQTLSIGAGNNVAANSSFGVTFGATNLSGDPIFDVANNGAGTGTLTLGRINDGGIRTITKTGSGTLIFGIGSGTSINYGTALVVNNGVAQVNSAGALGGSFTDASVTVNAITAGSTALFRLNNVSQRVASLTLGGTGGTSTSTNNVASGTGTLTVEGNLTYDATGNPLGSTISGLLSLSGFDRTYIIGDSSNADADLTISANITGSTPSGLIGLTKAGAGTLVLTGNNSFTRGVRIEDGVISVATLPASTSGSSTLGNGGTVQFAGGTLRYTGGNQSTTHVFAGDIGGGEIDITQSATVLTIASAFNGVGQGVLSDSLVKSGPGTLIFTGSNTNAGLDVIVDAGTLQLAKTSTATRYAIGGNLQVDAGGTAQLGGTGGNQIEDDGDVTVNAGGTFDFNGRSETFDGLSGGGSITNTGASNSTMTIGARNHLSGATTFSGVISNGPTNTMGVTKIGLSTQILSGTNTYTGATTLNAGKLLINGNNSAATGAVIVNDGATLGGSGVVGGATTVNSGGTLSPGNSPGILTFDSDLTLSDGAKVVFEGGDLVVVNGTLELDNWTLILNSNFQDGGSMTLFTFDTLDALPNLLPTFDLAGLGFTPSAPLTLTTEGSSIVLNGISAIPEPSAGLLIGLSLGLLFLGRRRPC